MRKSIIGLLGLSLITVFSCRNTNDNIDEGKGPVSININMLGINEADTESLKLASVGKVITQPIKEQIVGEAQYNKDYTIIATLAETPSTNINKPQALASSSQITTAPTPTLLDPNVVYTVMAFDTNGDLKASKSYTRNTQNQSITLDAGKTYTFIVVSYNNTLTPTTRQRIDDTTDYNNISGSSYPDMLYYKVTMEVKYGQQNYLNVVFRHVGILVKMTVDATPEMGQITAIQQGQIVYSGISSLSLNDININTINRMRNSKPSGIFAPVPFQSSEFPNQVVSSTSIIIPSGDADPSNIGVSSFRLQNISINGSVARSQVNIDIPNSKFEPGKSYNVKFTFQPTGIRVGNLIWARGNLAYDWTNKIYYNRYYPQETGSKYKDTDYWNYGSSESPLVPKKIVPYITDAANDPINAITLPIQDPCKLIAGGKWRMPTVSDFGNLGVYKVHNGGNTNGTTDGLPNTTFDGGTIQPNGDINANNFPYVYFDGTNEVGGTSTQLRFYKGGRYYGVVTNTERAAGYQNGGNSIWIPDAAAYMASDAVPFWTGQADQNMRAEMPIIYNGNQSLGSRTFNTMRGTAQRNWSADDRVPIRCVKNVTL
ncbi:hypothetical protein BBD32_08305 [Elizabethkingia anophelis]|uniref:Fimbrillin family protein n=1 Tax=Elizabethkingia anophelis TaxID=1117645 RepID=A0AAU8UZF1_9FLAO|nr:hypothetical protein BBD32_08305 [Elizabethkingia anophelis]OPB63926.1 hypothetical protein BAY11_16735 [Elizabethkingia anophelis]